MFQKIMRLAFLSCQKISTSIPKDSGGMFSVIICIVSLSESLDFEIDQEK